MQATLSMKEFNFRNAISERYIPLFCNETVRLCCVIFCFSLFGTICSRDADNAIDITKVSKICLSYWLRYSFNIPIQCMHACTQYNRHRLLPVVMSMALIASQHFSSQSILLKLCIEYDFYWIFHLKSWNKWKTVQILWNLCMFIHDFF